MRRPDDIRAGLSIAPRRRGWAGRIIDAFRDVETQVSVLSLAFAIVYAWMLARIGR